MSHHPDKALAPGERLSLTSSISSDLAEKVGTPVSSGAACLVEKVVESPVPIKHEGSIRGQAIKVPRGKRRGLFGRFSIIAEVEEPKDYPRRTKWFLTFVVGIAALAAPLGSTIIFPALPRIIDHFNSTATVANLAVSLYLLGMAIFPLWWSSFSEMLGRRTIYLISFSLFVLFSILLAESRSITMLIVLRMLVGGASASVQAVGAGTIADIWEVKERGRAMGIFYLGPLLGPLFGPIIGGLLAQNLGWRSTQWFLAVYGAILVLLLLFALPETLKALDARSLETQPNTIAIAGQSDLNRVISRQSLQQNTKKWLKISKIFLIDPLKIVLYLRFPAVFITIYYASITFSSLYLLNISMEVKLSEAPYNFNPMIIGLSYIPSSVGYIVASVAGGRWTDQIMAREAQKAGRYDENGKLVYRPEDRMRENAWIAAFLYPAALIWFGWTAEKGVHWAVPLTANFFFGVGSMIVFGMATTMLTEFMPRKASAGVALNNCIRNVFSAVGAVVAAPLIRAIGSGWLFTGVGIIAVLSSSIIWAMKRIPSACQSQMPVDNEKAPVKLSLPLEYQQDLFSELRSEDELVLLARGLGLLRIVINLLHSYDAAGSNLVVIVGADERENAWIGEALAEHAAVSKSSLARGLSQVNTDIMSVGTREKMYSQGGIFSITSRILVVDLLSKLLNPEMVTGLVVLHAERVVATSIEAFIIRIFRQFNKQGFLKAFSDNPEPFATGFSPLATMMRNLFLRKPSLWPRFHVTVAKSLEGTRKAEVLELEVPMTNAMKDIQNAVLECVEVSISELRKSGTGLELDDWNLDSALHKSFDVIIKRQLDPIWHRVSFRTKQIVNDLSVLRSILHALLTYDAVSFNKYLDTILAAHQPPPGSNRQNQSPWLFLDAANTIFGTAKRRVYTGKVSEGEASTASESLPESLRPVLEEQPKWAVLAEILDEIERDAYFNPIIQDDSNGSILVMCSDQETCRQLREYLQHMYVLPPRAGDESEDDEPEIKASAAFMMRRKLRNYLKWKKAFARVSASLFEENQKELKGFTDQRSVAGNKSKAPPNKRRRVRGGSSSAGGGRPVDGSVQASTDKDSQVANLLAEIQPTDADALQKDEVAVDSLDDMEDFFELYEMQDLVVVHPYDGDMDEHMLEEVKPRYVIMYEPDVAFIRRVEVYRSSHQTRNIKVYFMFYDGSVEEQRYLSAVRREKEAFTRLIKEKGQMAVTFTQDGRGPDDPQEQFLRTVNTRIAGGGRLAATAEPPRVVVDVREFRSSLPSLLHGRSMVVVPCMLTVGDYILTPNICIERKSVRDLISSFKNGRLFNQVETMLQHYKFPMLLIEFDQNKSFTLDPFADHSNTNLSPATNPSDLQSKLVLLTLAFPRLKVIWSSSPYETAEIFEELKKQQEEPDPIKAVGMGLVPGEDPGDQSWNQTPQEMLRAVPGITAKNMQRLTLEVEDLAGVANLTEEALGVFVGKEVGGQVFRFFNRSVFDE